MLLATYAYYPTGSVKTVTMGNSLTLTYTYHISGAVKTATVQSADGNTLYSETLYYEDCGGNGCTPQYNGNISRMAHELAHGNADFSQYRDVAYAYDQLNRLTKADDAEQDYFDEAFEYDAQGRIVAQSRDTSIAKNAGGEYIYYANTNRLKSIANGMGGTADDHNMSDANNFVYDSEGNLIEDKSKKMRITYDWRGMPVEFVREIENGDSLKLVMKYDGNGKRISKTRLRKIANATEWSDELTTHYTGIGTEIRTSNSGNADETKVVVNMPQGLGRYAIEYADVNDSANAGFEWYLKNHLGSTMAVYRTTGSSAGPSMLQHAYDYRSYGEKIDLTVLTDKVTENYTGKELDDETELGYWGARYLDLMLGMWISVDPMRQFASPYLYAGNGANPVNGVDPNGNVFVDEAGKALYQKAVNNNFWGSEDIRREYEFANTTSTKISLRRQEGLIGPEEHAGETMESYYDQINLMHGVSDDYKMLGATVTLSNEGSRGWSDYLNVTFDEAEARTAAHEFGAHIRMFSPKTPANDREWVEHDKYSDIDERLKTPRDQCLDYE